MIVTATEVAFRIVDEGEDAAVEVDPDQGEVVTCSRKFLRRTG